MRFDRSAALPGLTRNKPLQVDLTSVYPTAYNSSAYVPSYPLR
jgi:hypothetical protein